MRGLIAALAVTLASGCYDGTMDPGKQCGSCHGGRAKPFGAAGTVYADAHAPARAGIKGALIEITDARGTHVTRRSNSVGNFVVEGRLEPPFRVMVTHDGVTAMMPSAPNGDCNSCHGATGVPGRIHVPRLRARSGGVPR